MIYFSISSPLSNPPDRKKLVKAFLVFACGIHLPMESILLSTLNRMCLARTSLLIITSAHQVRQTLTIITGPLNFMGIMHQV